LISRELAGFARGQVTFRGHPTVGMADLL